MKITVQSCIILFEIFVNSQIYRREMSDGGKLKEISLTKRQRKSDDFFKDKCVTETFNETL